MTTTQPLESLKTALEAPANKIKRGLNGRVLLGTLAVLAALFAARIHSALARERRVDEFSSRSTADR